MYLPVGIENSPYRTLIAPEMWIEVNDDFTLIVYCCQETKFFFVMNAGCRHIPKRCVSNTRNN